MQSLLQDYMTNSTIITRPQNSNLMRKTTHLDKNHGLAESFVHARDNNTNKLIQGPNHVHAYDLKGKHVKVMEKWFLYPKTENKKLGGGLEQNGFKRWCFLHQTATSTTLVMALGFGSQNNTKLYTFSSFQDTKTTKEVREKRLQTAAQKPSQRDGWRSLTRELPSMHQWWLLPSTFLPSLCSSQNQQTRLQKPSKRAGQSEWFMTAIMWVLPTLQAISSLLTKYLTPLSFVS